MMKFDNEDDLEEWLATLNYEAFWAAIVGFPEVELDRKAAFDALIAEGKGSEAEILEGLKIIAQIRIAQGQDLLPQILEPAMVPMSMQ